MAIAVYDSVMAVEGGYEPFAVDVDAPAGASAEAAVAAAAHRILVHYLPAQAATILDPAYAASLATIPDGQAKTDGVATGEEVAALLIALRADDGFRAPVTYTPPNPPIPGRVDPDGAHAADRPLPRADGAVQPRLGRPVPAGRTAGARAASGGHASTTRSRRSARARARRGPPSRPWPPGSGLSRRCSRPVARSASSCSTTSSTSSQAARFMAMVSVTYADALIACFDAKYHYAFWRPITAIRAGDTDGNAATVGDPAWAPLLPGTPNHPEYPSAHSCITPAGGRVIARFLGTQQIDFTVPSLTGLGDRHFATVEDLRVRGRQRPHLGRHPLPLGRRGRGRDRQEGGQPGARPPLPQVEPLGRSTRGEDIEIPAQPRCCSLPLDGRRVSLSPEKSAVS